MELKIGMTGTAETVVTEALTAETAGSGSLPVFATPHMTALMERAAWTLVQPYLDAGKGTVGVHIAVDHTAATPVGMKVRATAVLTAVEGKMLTFDVTAEDETGEIGRGTHTRAIITEKSFLERTNGKLG